VQVFGRRHDEAIDALMRPATEKRQGHEIAMERVVAVPRALWGFGRGGWLGEFGLQLLGRSLCR
jgi:hypothetical protein